MGFTGKTSSTKWMAVSAIRRAPQDGQNPRRLQEKATKCSFGQDSHLALKNPWAKREIADAVGSSVESIIRIMSEWSKNGFVATNEQQITILRTDKIINLMTSED